MIRADQPTIFGDDVIAAVSSREDGNMKFGIADDAEATENRRRFLSAAGIDIDHATLVPITYNTGDFAKYRIAKEHDKGMGMLDANTQWHADALVTDQPGHALFLPLADCFGAVLYDPIHRVLMVSHLGKHSAEVEGGRKSVEFLLEHYASSPSEIKVWLSPAVGKESYQLRRMDGQGLEEVVTEQFLAAGVLSQHIESSGINTATSEHYFSHVNYRDGLSKIDYRFAIVAEMRVQGEPAV